MRRSGWILLAGVGLLWGLSGAAQEEAEPAPEAETQAVAPAKPEKPAVSATEALRTLLARVRETAAAERAEDRAREAAFQKARDEQEAQTLHTERLARQEEATSLELEETYGSNEQLLKELDARLTERIGQMGELFGVVRLVATDLSGEVYASLTSLGLDPRSPRLDKLGRNTGLPSTEDMQKLWMELLHEMTLQGQVRALNVPVVVEIPEAEEGAKPRPITEQRTVVRVGPFTAISEGEYLGWAPDLQSVEVFERQPPPRYVNTIDAFSSGGNGFRRLALDPSQGALLEALTGTPSLLERVHQGGYVGYTIVALGLIALGLGLARMIVLAVISRQVWEQQKSSTPRSDNPLGRLLGVGIENHDVDPETLELRLEESVLRESGGVERYLWVVQTISIIAPLLGLLGTVTGMIQTFQAITLFGAGDPKIMAGGISEALVTTTLGLVTAIPLVLLHALLASRARGVVDVLEERRAALVAERLETREVAA